MRMSIRSRSCRVTQSFVFKDEDALHDDHPPGNDGDDLLAAVVLDKIVHRALDGLPLAQQLQMMHQQLCFESAGLIVVDLAPILEAQVIQALVVIVVAEDGDLPLKTVHKIFHQCGLSAAGTAGDADDEDILAHKTPP